MVKSSRFLTVGLSLCLCSVVATADPVIELRPISADGVHTIVGNKITLDGPGQRVFLEVYVADWAPTTLVAYTGFLESAGYTTGKTGQLAPPFIPCNAGDDTPCVNAFGVGAKCAFPAGANPVACTAGFQDTGRADYVFAGVSHIPVVDLSTLNYRWSGAALGVGAVDPGTPAYAGTLVLDVPIGASGVFKIDWRPEPSSGFQDPGGDISPVILVRADIEVNCLSDADCDDGSDCTNDTCDLQRGNCINAPNFNDVDFCCNPVGGALTPIDDGNACTNDVCDPIDGTVTHDQLPNGAACGDPNDSGCDDPDTCDAAGICQPNLVPAGISCRTPVGICDFRETCDGVSQNCPPDELLAAGTVCRPAVDVCDAPEACTGASALCPADLNLPAGTVCRPASDICDSVESCTGASPACPVDLLKPAGTECRAALDDCDAQEVCDGLFASCPPDDPEPSGTACGDAADTDCTNPDTCDGAGNCDVNDETVGTSCGNPLDDDCTNPDTCDGSGGCLVNHEPNGLICIDDGNDCTDDVCEDGACAHPNKPSGAACGDLSDTDCNNPDTCDGAGTCQDNFKTNGLVCTDDGNDCTNDVCDSGGCTHPDKPVGTACGSATDTECDNPDTCDGFGFCEGNLESDGTSCSDDGNNCTDDFCVGGGCTHPNEVVGTACGDLSDTDCTDPDTCDGAGACQDNHANAGDACGSLADTDCDNPDTCDGAGSCDVNLEPNGLACTDDGNECTGDVCANGACDHPDEPLGTACGDLSDTDCTDPDTCSGGFCLDNHESNGTGCTDDGNDCTDDFCETGGCIHPGKPIGTACGDPVDTDCDNPDTCDGLGFCEGNLEADGTSCSDDGNDCTDDFCVGGGCTHPDEPSGTACGDLNDTDCTDPDTCDGFGFCEDNHANAGDACGSLADTDCDNPDTCDGAGSCDVNLEPNGLACTDDGNECTDDVCANGACDHPDEPLGTACGDLSDTDCTDPDTCSGGACLDNHESDGTGCTDDGNDCTDDVCETGGCTHPDKPIGTACGDPADTDCDNPDTCDGLGFCEGNLEADGTSCSDDGNDCTDDFCVGGGCTHPDEPSGTACGDPGDSDCTNPDTCNGFGFCEDNHANAGDACGSLADTDCDNPDTCDGAGSCDVNLEPNGLACTDDGNECTDDVCANGACDHPDEPLGTACGDLSDTDCTDPDTCSGGVCLDNHESDGTGCTDDGNDCTDDVCETGGCTHPDKPIGTACGDPADTDCDNPDTCDGLGFCEDNLEPDNTGCTDDGNDCTNDTCVAGSCTHPDEKSGTACGDPGDSDCTNPDTCDGFGFCEDNHENPGTACGDPADTDCDNPDTCDGAGGCLDNHEPTGTGCDDTLFCNGDDSCNTGVCEHTGSPCGGPCDEENDLCLCEAPIVVGIGNRYLRITPQPPGSGPQAILIKADCPGAIAKYVDPPQLFDLDLDGVVDENLATFDDPEAVLEGFLTPAEWGELYVYGDDIQPETTYIVWGDCGSPGNPGLSDSATATTPKFGDIVGVFENGEWTPPDGDTNIVDVLAIVLTFVGADGAPALYRSNMVGSDGDGITCLPDIDANILDVLIGVKAFQGLTFVASVERCTPVCP